MDWDALLKPQILAMLVPIAFAVYAIAARAMKHRERMAMIEKGMNPDAPGPPRAD